MTVDMTFLVSEKGLFIVQQAAVRQNNLNSAKEWKDNAN